MSTHDITYCSPQISCANSECHRHISHAPDSEHISQADLHPECRYFEPVRQTQKMGLPRMSQANLKALDRELAKKMGRNE